MKHLIAILLFTAMPAFAAESTSAAARAVNRFGLDLLQRTAKPNGDYLISPYSIQTALAMAYAGADGATRAEMARVLHYPDNDAALHGSFAALQQELKALMQRSADRYEQMKQYGGAADPIRLNVANRLFGQQGYDFRAPFLAQLKDVYGAPFEPVNFRGDRAKVAADINRWVEEQTQNRIRDLVSADALGELTRLVLVNAVYLKAPWADEFYKQDTAPRPFHVKGGAVVDVPTMTQQSSYGYTTFNGFRAVTMPYSGGELQFVILLPDKPGGLAALESKLTPETLADCVKLEGQPVLLHLPKFRIEPPLMPLGAELQAMGLKTAFDKPPGSANFDRMAPRRPDDYLHISEVFHKTFLELDERGTEAAAATAVMVVAAGMAEAPPKPIEVAVDRPFLFAIQHRPSGACLFLGHVADPR